MLEIADSDTSQRLAAPNPLRRQAHRYTEMCLRCGGTLRIKWVEAGPSRERHIHECVGCGLERQLVIRG